LVSIGTHHLHITCAGTGHPTVVFDAALGASSLSWSLVHPEVARFTRACVYDRAGFGWSEAGPLPRTAGRIADELWLLLRNSDLPPPYVLVGHSFGGLVTRLFTARHRAEVAGLVLIEPAIPEEWIDPSDEKQTLIHRGTRLCRVGERAARAGVARLVAGLVNSGALWPARFVVRVISRGSLRREDETVLAPIGKLPPEARGTLGDMWTQPKFFAALGSQIRHVCDSAAEVQREADAPYGDLPLIVISAQEAAPSRLQADEALARRSSRGRHLLAAGSGHWVPLDAPGVVIDGIADIVRQIRSSL
jgi:pimeloyl-ACP methyl ester carboxylesterase